LRHPKVEVEHSRYSVRNRDASLFVVECDNDGLGWHVQNGRDDCTDNDSQLRAVPRDELLARRLFRNSDCRGRSGGRSALAHGSVHIGKGGKKAPSASPADELLTLAKRARMERYSRANRVSHGWAWQRGKRGGSICCRADLNGSGDLS
jgi:hypothetical protein